MFAKPRGTFIRHFFPFAVALHLVGVGTTPRLALIVTPTGFVTSKIVAVTSTFVGAVTMPVVAALAHYKH